MKILITGGFGFIGSHLVEHFQWKCDVVILSQFGSTQPTHRCGLEYKRYVGSITDRETVRRAVDGVDYVFHLAAKTHGDVAEMASTNIIGTIILLEEAARAGVKKLVFSSTAAIQGDSYEGDPPELSTPYAISKMAGEEYCQNYSESGLLPTVILRYFNVYGPRDRQLSVVSSFIRNALKNEPLQILGDGEHTRDFIYVTDVVGANNHFAMTEDSGVFNIGTGIATTINVLAQTIISLTNSNSEIRHLPNRAGDITNSKAFIEDTVAHGFTPMVRLEEGLKRTIAAYAR